MRFLQGVGGDVCGGIVFADGSSWNSLSRELHVLVVKVDKSLQVASVRGAFLFFRQKEAVGFFYRKTALVRICVANSP